MTRISPAARHWILWVGGGFLVAWLVGIFWWSLLEPAGVGGPLEITIPEGAAAELAAGRPVPELPAQLDLGRAGEVYVMNLDVSPHYIGGVFIWPGTSATFKPVDKRGEVECSFHPGGQIQFTLDERPSIFVTVIPALLLGVPFGIAFGGAVFVARRLSTEEEAAGT